MSFVSPSMPDTTSLFQEMIDSFGSAGMIGVAVIGGAVALGVIVILGMWGWRLFKRWQVSTLPFGDEEDHIY